MNMLSSWIGAFFMNIFKAASNSTHIISVPIVAGVSLFGLIFFSMVNPASTNSTIVIAGAVVLSACVYVWSALIIRMMTISWPFSIRSQRSLAGALTLVSIFIVLMQSIGELSWRDVFAAVPLLVILYVYVGYFVRLRNTDAGV